MLLAVIIAEIINKHILLSATYKVKSRSSKPLPSESRNVVTLHGMTFLVMLEVSPISDSEYSVRLIITHV